MDPDSPPQVRLLHQAVNMFAASADEQLASLAGSVVTDELTLDFGNAFAILPTLEHEDGVVLDDEALLLLAQLDRQLSAPPGSDIWSDEALRSHPTWQQIRATAQAVKPYLP